MNTTRRIPDPAFSLLGELSRRTEGLRHAPSEVLGAVAILTAAADPDRADRLRPRAAEPTALVLRLAVWALRNLDPSTADLVVANARTALAGAPVPTAGSLADTSIPAQGSLALAC